MQLQLPMGNGLPSESENRASALHKTVDNREKLGGERRPHPRKVCTNWLSNAKPSVLKTYTDSIRRTEQAIFGNICVYTYIYMHAITIRKIRS